MKTKLIAFILLALLFNHPGTLCGQISVDDYTRADSLSKFSDLMFHAVYSPKWIDSTHFVWYKIKTNRGDEYFLVGELDDNVDPASTMQVANALIKAGKILNWWYCPV